MHHHQVYYLRNNQIHRKNRFENREEYMQEQVQQKIKREYREQSNTKERQSFAC